MIKRLVADGAPSLFHFSSLIKDLIFFNAMFSMDLPKLCFVNMYNAMRETNHI